MKRLIAFGLIFTFLISCNQKKESQKEVLNSKNLIEENKSKISSNDKGEPLENNESDKPKEWIKNIFKCKNSNKICFYLEKEKEVCTKQFYEFMIDSEELYGASNLTEEEYPNALKKYKEKWMKIYPLRKDMETWLFGRGQDDMENIQEVLIKKVSELKYVVDIDFGENIKTKSIIKLVLNNENYKIDYCETKFIE
jgi:hypothetical protein